MSLWDRRARAVPWREEFRRAEQQFETGAGRDCCKEIQIMPKRWRFALLFPLILCVSLLTVKAQQSAFTYQGKLTDNGSPANGNYDLQIALFDSASGGAQIGQTQSAANVAVTGGVFSVTLDFGPAAFPGAARFLEISTRPSGVGNYTLLTPRQAISATPYAVRSLNASSADNAIDTQKLGGVTAGNYVQINDARLSDSRPPAVGSSNYIQNTMTQQANSNFNVSGNGLVGGNLGIGTASPQHKLHVVGQGVRVQGDTATTTPRISWDFTGATADNRKWQIAASANGLRFTTLNDAENIEHTWLQVKRQGTFVTSLLFPDKVGFGYAQDPQFEVHVLGVYHPNIRVESFPQGAPSFPRFSWNFGQGAANAKKWQVYAASTLNFSALSDSEDQEDIWLSVQRSGLSVNKVLFPKRRRAKNSTVGGNVASFGAQGEFRIDASGVDAGRFVVKNDGRVGIGWPDPDGKLDVNGDIRFSVLGTAGSAHLCINSLNQISSCSSSLRYKTDLHPFTKGLNLINRLHPLTFRWKADQSLDLGLGAEDVAAVEPLLVTHNEKGEVEGVKYDRLSAVFINAFKEQQSQIQQQQAQIASQADKIKSQGDALAALQTRLALLEQARRHQPQRKSIRKRT